MFKLIADWVARFFAPALKLLGEVPPSALQRLVTPF